MTENYNKTVGHRIKTRREKLNLTGKELGELVKYSQGRISQIESGRSSIDLEKLIAFSKALDTDVAYFISELL